MSEDTVYISTDDLPPEDERPPEVALIVLEGKEIGRRYLLNEASLVLGRGHFGVDVRIDDDTVSGRHCRIETDLDTGAATIEDLGSRNGTRVEGERVERAVLGNGARIRLGTTLLKLVLLDRAERELFTRLDADSLTDLPLKRVFTHSFHDAFERDPDQPMSALMMDMDGLKAINDSHGHQMGAFCIRTVGKLIAGAVSGRGRVCRFGGDEFIAYLPGSGLDAAEEIAETIRAAVEAHEFTRDGVTVAPTISIGVAERSREVKSAEELTRLADDALYRAKRAGRNCVSR